MAISWLWSSDAGFFEHLIPKDMIRSKMYLNSPVRPVKERKLPMVRIRPQETEHGEEYNLTQNLRADGFTDYIALPIASAGKRDDVVSFSTRVPTGYRPEHISFLQELVVQLQPQAALQAQRILTRVIAQLYLGENTGARVLSGDLTRGSLTELHAAIWLSDIRGFTQLSREISAEHVLGVLNSFFETIYHVTKEHGGEILKLMGDAALVVFPRTEVSDECSNALNAALKALGEWPKCYTGPEQERIHRLTFGIGLDFGSVLYGNIGAQNRLDFTVIGDTVNFCSRLAEMCGSLELGIVCSDTFAGRTQREMVHLGPHQLRGFPEAQDLYSPVMRDSPRTPEHQLKDVIR
jgi:adenylate cyclase